MSSPTAPKRKTKPAPTPNSLLPEDFAPQIPTWDELTISNDFMFAKVMRKKKICKAVIELLLGIKVARLEYPERQKTVDL